MRCWFPPIILATAQFVMVLDSSVMNVSISQVVADLDTTDYGDAQLDASEKAILAVSLLALVSIVFTRRPTAKSVMQGDAAAIR